MVTGIVPPKGSGLNMLYLDGRQGLSEFVLRCPDLSGWDEIPQPLVARIEKGIKKRE